MSHDVAFVLSAHNTVDHLLTRQVLASPDRVVTRELAGGVSGVVVLVEGPAGRLVVKQALPTLRTDQPWHADPARVLTEGAALIACATSTPGRVPPVVDVDPAALVLVMEAAPAHWRDWRSALLADALGDPDHQERVAYGPAAELGRVLACWHAEALDAHPDYATFADRTAFQVLRVDPFHRHVRTVHPDRAAAIDACIGDLESAPVCFVHGDYSPKNVLFGPDGLWVLDHEVAHLGAPVFDLAFLVSHLVVKAVHRPEHAAVFRAAGTTFLAGYDEGAGRGADVPRLAWHVATLVLARVDGTSPAGYLDAGSRRRCRTVARDLLAHAGPTVDELWTSVERAAADA